MRINVLLFASAAEALQASELALDLAPGVTAGEVRDLILALAPAAAGLPPMRMAVNLELVGDGHEVLEGDEVAMIPPVAGG